MGKRVRNVMAVTEVPAESRKTERQEFM